MPTTKRLAKSTLPRQLRCINLIATRNPSNPRAMDRFAHSQNNSTRWQLISPIQSKDPKTIRYRFSNR
jgi:hypothetical protein